MTTYRLSRCDFFESICHTCKYKLERPCDQRRSRVGTCDKVDRKMSRLMRRTYMGRRMRLVCRRVGSSFAPALDVHET